MIRRFKDFINESIDSVEIRNLIEDSFTPMCDENGMDFEIIEGYFINTIGSNIANQWITHQLLGDVKFMFREENAELIYKRAFQVTFLKNEVWSHRHIGDISDVDKIESLNMDFQEGIRKFNRFNSNYKLVNLPSEIKSTFWQIVFYVVSEG